MAIHVTTDPLVWIFAREAADQPRPQLLQMPEAAEVAHAEQVIVRRFGNVTHGSEARASEGIVRAR
jgi:hypothetical protein